MNRDVGEDRGGSRTVRAHLESVGPRRGVPGVVTTATGSSYDPRRRASGALVGVALASHGGGYRLMCGVSRGWQAVSCGHPMEVVFEAVVAVVLGLVDEGMKESRFLGPWTRIGVVTQLRGGGMKQVLYMKEAVRCLQAMDGVGRSVAVAEGKREPYCHSEDLKRMGAEPNVWTPAVALPWNEVSPIVDSCQVACWLLQWSASIMKRRLNSLLPSR